MPIPIIPILPGIMKSIIALLSFLLVFSPLPATPNSVFSKIDPKPFSDQAKQELIEYINKHPQDYFNFETSEWNIEKIEDLSRLIIRDFVTSLEFEIIEKRHKWFLDPRLEEASRSFVHKILWEIDFDQTLQDIPKPAGTPVYIWTENRSWVIKSPDPNAKTLFGTDILPLPFTDEAENDVVREHVQKIYPNHLIVIR